METIKIGILGLGTVGSGVIRILRDHAEKISNITGRRLEVKTVVVHNLKKKRSVDLTGINLTDNADDVLCDDEIQMVVEVMGTVNIAKEYIERALKAGKHVITANKDLIATHGPELISLAKNMAAIFAMKPALPAASRFCARSSTLLLPIELSKFAESSTGRRTIS